MRIGKNSIHSSDTVQHISQQLPDPVLVQTDRAAQHGDVSSLAREGQQIRTQEQLTQHSHDAEGQAPTRQKHKKLNALKAFFKLGKNSSNSSPSSIPQSQLPPSRHQANVDVNLPQPAIEIRRSAKTDNTSHKSRWASRLGFHSHKKKEQVIDDSKSDQVPLGNKTSKPESANSLRNLLLATHLSETVEPEGTKSDQTTSPSDSKYFSASEELSDVISEPPSLRRSATETIAAPPSTSQNISDRNTPKPESANSLRNLLLATHLSETVEPEGTKSDQTTSPSDSEYFSASEEISDVMSEHQNTRRLGKEVLHYGETSGSKSDSLPSSIPSLPPEISLSETIVPPQINIENGKLVLNPETPAALATVIKETLGRDSQEYTHHESRSHGHEQFLLDTRGRIFQVTTHNETGIVALHSSTPLLRPDSEQTSLHEYLSKSGHTGASASDLAIATGIHTDTIGKHWRIHNGKLYQLDNQGEWQRADPAIRKLSQEGNSQLYGLKSNHQLVNIAKQTEVSTPTSQDITSFSLNKENEVALLLKPEGDESARLRFLPSVTANPNQALDIDPHYNAQTNPELKEESLQLVSIGMSGDKLFAIDAHNHLLAAPLPKSGQPTMLFSVLEQAELQNALGKDVQFEDFSHDETGHVSLLARDHSNQLHSCSLNESGKTFKPGWNLSDILHIDNQKGFETHTPSHIQEFDKQGAISFENGNIYAKDRLTQQWNKIAGNVQSLIRGHDGQPYILQNGELKTLSIKEKSGSIRYGENNIFSIAQSLNNIELGSGPTGVPSDKLISAAIINSHQHVTLTESNRLKFNHIRSGTNTPVSPEHEISHNGLGSDIRQIGIGQDKRLYALTAEGKLLSLSAKQWHKPQASQSNHQWVEESFQELAGELKGGQLGLNKDRQLTLTTAAGDCYIKQDEHWQATPTTANEHIRNAHDNNTRNDFFNNLSEASKGFRINKDGVQYKVTAQLGGVLGMESKKISSKFTDRLKAHVFKPTLELPRPIKVASYNVQHQWKGREGLKNLYKQESSLYKQLEFHNTQIESKLVPERSADIKTRLEQLNLGRAGQSFKDELEAFRQELEISAERQLIKLGKHQGVLKADGELNPTYKPSKLKEIKQAMNPNRSGHHLSKELLTSWEHMPASSDSRINKLLKSFIDMNVNMSHQKTEIPLGRQRDPNDKMALAKARLVLDTLTLHSLDQLLDKAALLADTEPNANQVNSLKNALSQIRDETYEKNQIKTYTDRGMSSNQNAEANYDATKFFLKAMSKPDHGVNLLLRSALEAKDQTQLSQKLAQLMHMLKPMDEIIISRNYSGETSAIFTPSFMQDKFISMFPSATLAQKRSYSLEFTHKDNGVEISINGNLGPSGQGSLGINRNLLPNFTGSSEDAFKFPLNGGDQTFKPDFVVGAGLTAGGEALQHNELKFHIHEADIDQFAESLTNGTLTPNDLIDQGSEHISMHGSKYSFSVDLGLNVTARARLNLTDKDNDNTAMMRIGGGVSAGVNLFSTKRDNLKYHGLENTKFRKNNTTGMFNTASASVDVGITTGVNIAREKGDLTAFGNARTAISASVDNSIKIRGELKSKTAEPVTEKMMGKLFNSLATQFPDSASKKLLKNIKSLDINSQLSALSSHFLKHDKVTPKNDTQHAALMAIHKLEIQHLAASRGADVISEAKTLVIHYNPNHLDHQGILNFLLSLVAPSQQDPLAEKIRGMMKEDPIIGKILSDSRLKPNTYTWVTLELKDDVRIKLEKEFAQGKLSITDMQQVMNDPENRRLRSITIFETGRHREGFDSPTLFVGGSSSASIYMERSEGTIAFSYGADQNTPRSYTIGGEIASSKQELTQAISELKKEGLEVKH
jgi:hypothetical protein